MKLKEKLLLFASNKIIQKVSQTNFATKARDITKSKAQTEKQKIINRHKEKNYFIIKKRCLSLGTVINLAAGEMPENVGYQYQIFNKSNSLKYSVTSGNDLKSNFTSKENLFLYNKQNELVGKISECLISGGFPIFAKEAKRCVLFYKSEKICEIKKFISFGSLTVDADRFVKFNLSDEKKYRINFKGKSAAILSLLPTAKKDGLVDSYVVEIKNSELEEIGLLLSIALDFLLS